MIIADTGFFLALANPKDRYHGEVAGLRSVINEPLVTTWSVMTETGHLLLSRLGVHALVAFIESFNAGAFRVHELSVESIRKLPDLIRKYADLPMDLTDASLVLLAEEIGDGRILSTDARDFKAYRWKSRKPFKNLLGS